MFWFRRLRSQNDCMEATGASAPTEPCKQKRGENPKAIEILIPNRCPNLINSLPEISIIYSGNFLSRTFKCSSKTTYLVLEILEVAHYNILQDTLGTKTSKGLQWGRVKGLELRDSHSRTLGVVPRGDLRHFVAERIYIYIYSIWMNSS